MSSEESCDEETAAAHNIPSTSELLQVRGLPWRSTRLRNFYDALDREEDPEVLVVDNMSINKPRRVIPRKERCIGLPKDDSIMPPKGVADWMVSRKWIRDHPDFRAQLRDLIVDYPGFNWNGFRALGDESEDEFQQVMPGLSTYILSSSSSSLAHALMPM